MKKTIKFLLALLSVMVWTSCSQSTSSEETEEASEKTEQATQKDVDQLTWQDVIALVFDDEGEGIEWHGEEMPNELAGFLTITTGGPCGENDCGMETMLTNTSDQAITTIVRGDYDIEGDVGYIPRKYSIEAGDTLIIGCSHLCYGGKGYEFPRTVVASSYSE